MNKRDIKIVATILGVKGSGKTTLACSSPKPLLLDLERGAYRSEQSEEIDCLTVKNFSDIDKIISDKNLLDRYETIVFDTVADLVVFMKMEVCKNPERVSLMEYGIIRTKLATFHRRLKTLNKHIVYLAHTIEADKTKKDNSVETEIKIDCEGSFKDTIVNDATMCGLVWNKRGQRVFDVAGEYAISFRHGNSMGITEALEIPTVSPYETGTFLSDLFDRQYAYWDECSKKHSDKRGNVMKLKEMFSEIGDVEALNVAYGSIKEVVAGDTYLKYLCNSLLDDLRVKFCFRFDKQSNKFIGE